MEATLPDGGEHIKEADSPLLQLYCPVNEEDFVFAKVTNRVKQFTKITRIQHFPDQNQLMVSWRTGIGRVRLDSAQLDHSRDSHSKFVEFLHRPEIGGLIASCIEIGPDMYLVHSNQSPTLIIRPGKKSVAKFRGEYWPGEIAESIQVVDGWCYWITNSNKNQPSFRTVLVRCNLAAVRQSVEAGVQELDLDLMHNEGTSLADIDVSAESVCILVRDGEVTERSLETPFPVLRKCRLPTFEAQVGYLRLTKTSFGFLCLCYPQGYHNQSLMLMSLSSEFPLRTTAQSYVSGISMQNSLTMKTFENLGQVYCSVMQSCGTMILWACSREKNQIVWKQKLDAVDHHKDWYYTARLLEVLTPASGDRTKYSRLTLLCPGLAGQIYRFYLGV